MAIDPKIAASVLSTAVGFVSGIFKGHSDWWHFDNQLKKGDYNGCANLLLKFYAGGGINHPDFKGTISQNGPSEWIGQPRYNLIPVIEAKTGKYEIKQLHQAFVNAGILPPTADYKTPAIIAAEAAAAKAKADADAYAKANPLNAAVKSAGLNPMILYFGLGIPAAALLVWVLIKAIKKKRK